MMEMRVVVYDTRGGVSGVTYSGSWEKVTLKEKEQTEELLHTLLASDPLHYFELVQSANQRAFFPGKKLMSDCILFLETR